MFFLYVIQGDFLITRRHLSRLSFKNDGLLVFHYTKSSSLSCFWPVLLDLGHRFSLRLSVVHFEAYYDLMIFNKLLGGPRLSKTWMMTMSPTLHFLHLLSKEGV